MATQNYPVSEKMNLKDSLNLDELSAYIEEERYRKANLKRNTIIIISVLIGCVILAKIFDSQFWLFSPTSILIICMSISYGRILYHRAKTTTQQYKMARKVIEPLLPDDQTYHVIMLSARMAFEFVIFSIAIFIGAVSLGVYIQLGILVVPSNIFADLSTAPQWAISFLLSWSVILLIAGRWIYRIWQNKSQLSSVDWQKFLSRHIRQGLGMIIFVIGVTYGRSGISSSAMVIGILLVVSYSISWFLQKQLLNLFVNPHLLTGNYDEALKQIRRWLRFRSHALFLRYTEVLITLLSGNYAIAEKLWWRWFIDTQNQHPKNVHLPLVMLSNTFERQKRFDEALRFAEATVEVYPTGFIGYTQLASIYIDLNTQPERALELIRFAVSLQTIPQPVVTGLYAVSLAQNGQLDSAVDMLQSIDENSLPSVAAKSDLACRRAQVALLQGNKEEARQFCKQAIAIDPNGDPIARELLQSLGA